MVRICCCLSLSLFSLCMLPDAQATPRASVQTSDPAITTHKVAPGETLYALAKKYGVTVAEFNKLNPEAAKGLRPGQVLRVPAKKNAGAPKTADTIAAKPAKTAPAEKPAPLETKAAVAPAKPTVPAGSASHKVSSGESLYSIAIKHGVTMAELRKWNNLKTDKLSIGKVLTVSSGESTAVAPPAKPVTVAKPAPVAKPESVITKTEVKVKDDKVKTETKTVKTVTENDSAGKADEEVENKTVEFAGKITETGLAEVISQVGENTKFLALHKTAPVGTILQVRNIMNGQNVYVRVIGKLPDTGINDKLIVRISKQAYQRLAALDNRFRVEVSYMP
jgi:LysM repeat protein